MMTITLNAASIALALTAKTAASLRHACLAPVAPGEDIDFLIKEAEILYGAAGRDFAMPAPAVIVLHMELRPGGYLLTPLDGGTAQFVDAATWWDHPVARSLRAGWLFTVHQDVHGAPGDDDAQ